jgi:hypothetical protein
MKSHSLLYLNYIKNLKESFILISIIDNLNVTFRITLTVSRITQADHKLKIY